MRGPCSGRAAPGSPEEPGAVLRADVHAVLVGHDLVLLDVEADRYLCVRGSPDERLRLLDDGRRLVSDSRDLLADLAAEGLTVGRDDGAARPAVPRTASPVRTMLRTTYDGPQLSDVAEACRGLSAVALGYRGRTFAEVIGRSWRRRDTGRPAEDVEAIVDRFHRWIAFAPVSGKCLLRSFMLRVLLQQAGHAPLWVFGVQTWPFRAHCWLQVGDTVLDDMPDRVSAYAPILVV